MSLDTSLCGVKPGHLATRLGCAETKVATLDDLAFKLIILGWNAGTEADNHNQIEKHFHMNHTSKSHMWGVEGGKNRYQESSKEEEGLGDRVDASKQERIAKIDADEDLSLIYDTSQDQGRMNNEDLFGINDLDGDEVIVDVTANENLERDATVAKKEVSAAADEIVTTAESVKEIKAAKPTARGVIVQEPSEIRTTSSLQPSQLPQAKDKAMDLEVIEGSKKTQAKVTEGSYKRAGDEIEQESAKRKRLEKEDDITELKRCL
nr:hypothetical protein [Tanacetum cinerariifolium]